jgi:hypothetical protein
MVLATLAPLWTILTTALFAPKVHITVPGVGRIRWRQREPVVDLDLDHRMLQVESVTKVK